MGSNYDLIHVDYWLPITRLHLTGSLVTSEKNPSEPKAKPTAAVVTVLTRPDYKTPCRLSIPAEQWAKQHAKIDLTSDGRLAGTETSNEDHRWDGFTAALGLVTTGASVGAAIGGPFGAAAGVALGALGAAITTRSAPDSPSEALELDRNSGSKSGEQTQTSADAEPDYKKLGVDLAYVKHDPANAEILGRLRQGEAAARIQFSRATAHPDNAKGDTELNRLRHRLRNIRSELARAETEYQKWIDTETVVTTENFDVEIDLSELPATADAFAWLHPDKSSNESAEATAFRAACKALKVVITCDATPVARRKEETAGTVAERRTDRVWFRPLQPVVLQVWTLPSESSRSHQLGDDARQSVQRILAALRDHEQHLPVSAAKKDSAISMAFSTDGALTSLSSDRTGARVKEAQAITGVPSALKDAFDAGTDIAAPFTAAGRAAALTYQLAETKARAALAPAADPNQKLIEAVTKAELQARLRAAQVAAGSTAPPVSVVVVGNTEPPS